MPRFYCDYCDTYLTHDSFSGRKQHQKGKRHQDNVRQYYMQFLKRGILDNMQNILIPGMGSVPTTSQAAARATPGRPGSKMDDAPLIPNSSLIGHKMPKVPASMLNKKDNEKESGHPMTHPARAALMQESAPNPPSNAPPRPPRYSDLENPSGFGGGGHRNGGHGSYGPSRGSSFGAPHHSRHNPYR